MIYGRAGIRQPVTWRLGLTAAALPVLVLAACASSTPEPSAESEATPVPTTEPEAAVTARGPEDTLRHFAPSEFVIGSAVAGGGHHLAESYPDPFSSDEPYRERLAAEFSSVTPENQLKWDHLRPTRDEFDFGDADAILEFAEQNGQQVRGHALLWHAQNPLWLEDGDFSPDELREILREHVSTVVGRYAGRIAQWDVANEIFDDDARLRTDDNVWIRELGPEIIADVFRWAHEADPDALLFINDYNVESIGPKSDAYYGLVQELRAATVPVHGFGVQGHLSIQYGFPSDVQANLQRFADLGMATAVTELDVRIVLGSNGEPSDEQLAQQADYYRQMLDACLAVTGCDSFTLWGFTDTYSWVPSFFTDEGAAAVMWADLTRKPAYCDLQATLAEAAGMSGDEAFTSRACADLG